MRRLKRLGLGLACRVESWIARLSAPHTREREATTWPVSAEVVAIERLVCVIRLIGATGSAIIVPFLDISNYIGVYIIIVSAILYSLVLIFIVLPLKPHWLQGGFIPWIFDITALTFVVAVTGGIHSEFFVIYYLSAILQCLRFGVGQVIFTPVICTVSYLTAVMMAGHSVVANAGVISFRLVWVFIAAFVSAVVVQRTRSAEASMSTELRRARALLQAAHAPATSLTVDGVVDSVLQQARLLAEADGAAVYLHRREGLPAVFRSEGAQAPELGAFAQMVRSNSQARRALVDAGRALTPPELIRRVPSVPGGVAQLGSLCAAPIPGRRGEIGLVAVAYRDAAGLNPVHYEALTAFLQRAALALQNARLYEQLQAQVEELRSLHDQIVRAERLAALGELAAKVAHELNNPLTSIHLYSSLLLEAPAEPDEQRRLAASTLEQAERAKQVVRDILDYSRPTEPKLELTSLNVTIESGLRLVRHLAHAARVSIIEDYAGNLPPVRVDAAQIAQICTNLALNAIQAMSSGGTLIVSTGAQGDFLYVSFKDNGCGIPPDQLPRVFEPFFTTKPAGQGTGLGLAVCRSLALQQHGEITVESEVGKGSTFTLWLPAAGSQEGMIAGPHPS